MCVFVVYSMCMSLWYVCVYLCVVLVLLLTIVFSRAVKARIACGLFVAYDLYTANRQRQGRSQIDGAAHLGGLAVGILYYLKFRRGGH